jgi:hypothetical protein
MIFVGFSRSYSMFLFVFYITIENLPTQTGLVALLLLYSINQNFIHSSLRLVMVYLLPDNLGCDKYIC